MRRLLLFITLMSYVFSGYSQPTIVSGEYYWNNDPGVGNGTAFLISPPSANINETINAIAPLNIGQETEFLFIRVKDENGIWSIATIQAFAPSLPNITAMEYFWDNDPGIGNGITVPITQGADISESFNITAPILDPGIHILYVRVGDEFGNWSIYNSRFFISHPTIVAAEYFWDIDPGLGNGTSLNVSNPMTLINESFIVNTNGLPAGERLLFLRTQDNDGKWSIVVQETISVIGNVYVDHTATGNNNGTSWVDAYTDLKQAMLNTPVSATFHVAEGSYYPDLGTGHRDSSFVILPNQSFLGGYPSGGELPANRAPETYEVILTGNIGMPSDSTDNSYHVIYSEGIHDVTIDGFTIREGVANGGGANSNGGGWLNIGSPTSTNVNIINVIFGDNAAASWGGAMYNDATSSGEIASPYYSNCEFSHNWANTHGGAIINFGSNNGDSSPTFENCSFHHNTAALNHGGAVFNDGFAGNCDALFINSEFYNNSAGLGGAISNFGETSVEIVNCSFANNNGVNGEHIFNQDNGGITSTTVVNCLFDDNGTQGNVFGFSGASLNLSYSIIDGPLPSGATDGGNNLLNTDPLYINPGLDDLSLQIASPAIDAGNDVVNSTISDLSGTARIQGNQIDIGAFEAGVSGCTDPAAYNYNPSATVDDGSCETCTDGIQNGDETDVDCGGNLCGPCGCGGVIDVTNYWCTTLYSDFIHVNSNNIEIELSGATGVGPYDVIVNGVTFIGVENNTRFTVDWLNDFGIDFSIPGNYSLELQSIVDQNSNCQSTGSLHTTLFEIVPYPDLSYQFTCDGNDDLVLSVIHNGNGGVPNAYIDVYHSADNYLQHSFQLPVITPAPGTVMYSEVLNVTNGYNLNSYITLNCGAQFLSTDYTSPCGSILGCTDPAAHNYNALATVDDGSCETCSDGIQNGDETGIDCGGSNLNCTDCCGELDFSGNSGFTSNIVSPLIGNPTDNYRFEIKYTNDNGIAPSPGFPKVLLDYEGDGMLNSSNDMILTMAEVDAGDQDVTDGKLYYLETTGLIAGEDYETTIQVINPCGLIEFGPYDEPDILDPVDVNVFASDISFSNSNPNPGDMIDVMVTIHNVSSYVANNFSVRLSNQFDGTIYPDITGINLPAGNSTTLTWTITTPAQIAFVPVEVNIDIDNVLPEPNELDNVAVRPFINGAYSGNTTIMVDANVVQNGPNTALLTGFAWYDDLPLPLPDTSVAGGEVEVNFNGTLYTTLTDENGEFTIVITPPAGNYSISGTITDFTLTGNFNINGFQSCKPDLAFTSLNVNSTATVFDDYTFNYQVKNIGCTDAIVSSILRINSTSGLPSIVDVSIPPLDSGEVYNGSLTLQFTSTGVQTITGILDHLEVVDEYIESNNQFSEDVNVVAQPCPGIDLRVTSIQSPLSVNECGAEFMMNLYNGGTNAAGPFKVVLQTDNGGGIEFSDTITVGGLNSLATTTVSYFVTFNQPGSYTLNALVDIDDDQVECDESNNVGSTIKTIQQCDSDLAVECTLQSTAPSDAMQGINVITTVVISNIGNDDLTDDIDFEVNYNGSVTTYTIIGGLLSGNTHTETINLVSGGPGASDIQVVVDPQNDIAELNENNNTINSHLGYDFDLQALCFPATMFWEKTYLINQPINLNAGIRNLGLIAASSVGVEFKVISGPGVGAPYILANGLTTSLDLTCGCPIEVLGNVPASFALAGTYQIEIIADPQNGYPEEDEGNNAIIVSLDIIISPDYLAKAEYIQPSELNPDPGENITIDLTIENIDQTNLDSINVEVLVDEIFLDEFRIKGLVSGDQFTATVPMTWSSTINGAHVIRYIIDSDEEIPESNELNNEATRTVIVGAAPNLVITDIVDNTSVQGQQQTLTYNILNSGALNGTAYVKLLEVIESGDTLLIGRDTITVNSGLSTTGNVSYIPLNAGQVTLLAIIEGSSPQEVNELDNTYSEVITVQPVCVLEVNTTGDNGYGSLREAIVCANNNPGPDTITFNIPGAGPHIILLDTILTRMIDDSTIIDGTTQPGNFPMAGEIIIDMTYQGPINKVGIIVDGEDCQIHGIEWQYNSLGGNSNGIFLSTTANNFSLGSANKGNWFKGDRWTSAVFLKENINEGKIQGNVFEAIINLDKAVIINSGSNNVLVGGNNPGEGNTFLDAQVAAIELRDGSNFNQVRNNHFENNVIGIFNNGDFLSGTNRSNVFSENIFLCNDVAIDNTPNANLGIQPPTITTSKVNYIAGTSLPGATIELYADPGNCGMVADQGAEFIGSTQADPSGDFQYVLPAASARSLTDEIVATQTIPSLEGTSEFTAGSPVDSLCLDFVYTCDDNIIGSLRSAIDCANPGETIYFLSFLHGDTLMVEDHLVINKNMVIEGLNGMGITVQSSADDFVVRIDNGFTVTLKELIIIVEDQGASGIIENLGTLNLENVTLIDQRTGQPLPTIINQAGAELDLQGLVKLLRE